MSPQLSYAEQAPAFAGMLGDQVEGTLIEAGVLGGSTNIPFGVFVVETTAANGVSTGTPPPEGTGPIYQLPSAAAANAAIGTGGWRGGGIVMQSHEYDKRLDFDANGLVLPTRQLNVVRKGRIWVSATTAMAKDDPVYARYTVNGALNPGTIGNVADSAKAQLLWGAKVVIPTAAPGLCQIEIDMNAFITGDQAP